MAFSSPPFQAKFGSPLPAVGHFACLPGCGLCCTYQVRLTQADQSRLKSNKQSPGKLSPWEMTADDHFALRRVKGFCLFLDSKQRCSVYDRRPDQCRTYPYLWTTYLRPELDVDFSCPGLGQGAEISLPAFSSQEEAHQTQRLQAIQHVQNLLIAQRRFSTPEMLVMLGEQYIQELKAVWPAVTLRVNPKWDPNSNLETSADMSRGDGWVQPDNLGLIERGRLERHFGEPHRNSRLHSDGSVSIYRFWVAGDFLHIELADRGRIGVGMLDRVQPDWQSEALDLRQAYLEQWLKRQLPQRLAYNMAVARLLEGLHVASCFLGFLAEVDWRLAVLAQVLAKAYGKEEVDKAIVLEAIRGSDNLMRAWCESAQLGAFN